MVHIFRKCYYLQTYSYQLYYWVNNYQYLLKKITYKKFYTKLYNLFIFTICLHTDSPYRGLLLKKKFQTHFSSLLLRTDDSYFFVEGFLSTSQCYPFKTILILFWHIISNTQPIRIIIIEYILFSIYTKIYSYLFLFVGVNKQFVVLILGIF